MTQPEERAVLHQADIEDDDYLGASEQPQRAPAVRPPPGSITIRTADLRAALSRAVPIMRGPESAHIPILTTAMLVAAKNVLRVTATNMDVWMAETVLCACDEAVSCVLPVAPVYAALANFAGDETVVQIKGTSATISSGRHRLTIPLLDFSTFPTFAIGAMATTFSMDRVQFLTALAKAAIAQSSEETRHYLNGVYLHIHDTTAPSLRFVATDGAILAIVERDIPEGAYGMQGCIIPRATVGMLLGLLSKADCELLTVSASETQMRFVIGPVLLATKLISGTFPEYQRVVPEVASNRLRFMRSPLLAAVRLASVFESARLRPVRLTVSEGSVVLSNPQSEKGACEATLGPADAEYDGEPISLVLKAKDLLEVASATDGDIEITMKDNVQALRVRHISDDTTLYVLITLRF